MANEHTEMILELLKAETIDLYHWASLAAKTPDEKKEVEGISDRITDLLDRLGAFDDPDT